NAIKYTDRGSVSLAVKTVSSKPDSVKLSFEITDTGIGIETEKQKELFMPYYQIEDTGLLKKDGHGLGLVISKKIIELMNGNLYFESRHGKGSKFWFILELKKSGEERAQDVTPSETAADIKTPAPACETIFNFGENFSVLITEDNSFNQKLIHSFLIKKGVKKIEIAANGEECFNICKRQHIPVVIMDCQMPVMDGLTSAALIREYERSAGRPRCAIIALTADTVYGTREKCIRAGMDDYLTKPIDFDLLYGKLVKIAACGNSKNWSDDKMNKEEPLQQEKSEIIKNENEDLIFDPKLISDLKKLQIPGKPDIICQLFTIYLKETSAKIESLKEALREGAADSIRHIAHNLKSSTANVGGVRLSAIFKKLENKAKNNETENLETFIPEIDSNYKSLNEKLRQLIDGKEIL
ncbi:MAG TPA: response regulator, partial [Candidatus Wallbacteria bacterium]|nr:response regulator [Candidatus Wallbacteria bacterium]